MGRCRRNGDLAARGASHAEGVRTRARALALALALARATSSATVAAGARSRSKMAEPGGRQITYLKLRSRSIALTPRIAMATASSASVRCPSPDQDPSSRCSTSNAKKDERRRHQSGALESAEGLASTASCSEGGRETTPSSGPCEGELDGMESTSSRSPSRISTATPERMPSEAEMKGLFEAAERAEQQRFAGKYNYDVVRDAPLDGRYEWVPLKP